MDDDVEVRLRVACFLLSDDADDDEDVPCLDRVCFCLLDEADTDEADDEIESPSSAIMIYQYSKYPEILQNDRNI